MRFADQPPGRESAETINAIGIGQAFVYRRPPLSVAFEFGTQQILDDGIVVDRSLAWFAHSSSSSISARPIDWAALRTSSVARSW